MENRVQQLKAERAALQKEAAELSDKLIAGQTARSDVATIRAEAEAVVREEIEAHAHALATRKPVPDFTAKREALATRLWDAYSGKPSPDSLAALRKRELEITARLTEINATLNDTALQGFLDGLPKLAEVEEAARALMQAEDRREATKAALLELATRFKRLQKPALAHKCRLAREHFCDEEKRVHVERAPSVERLKVEMTNDFHALMS